MMPISKNELEQVWNNACNKVKGDLKSVLIGDLLREVRVLSTIGTNISDKKIIQILAISLRQVHEENPLLTTLTEKIKNWEPFPSLGFMTRIRIRAAAEQLKPTSERTRIPIMREIFSYICDHIVQEVNISKEFRKALLKKENIIANAKNQSEIENALTEISPGEGKSLLPLEKKINNWIKNLKEAKTVRAFEHVAEHAEKNLPPVQPEQKITQETPPNSPLTEVSPQTQKPTQPSSPYMWQDKKRALTTVAERLNNPLKKGEKPSYVSFINPAYDKKYQTNDCLSTWKIHISINPEQRNQAWPIIQECLLNTPLRIQGKIHQDKTTGNIQPGKEIVFLVDSTQETPEIWQQFLSDLATKFNEAKITLDTRPINSDKEQATRKWDAVIATKQSTPLYFNYRTDLYTVIDDTEWTDITAGYSKEASNNIAYYPGSPEKMIKKSYFQKLPENQKHNPLELPDFLKKITL